MENPLLVFVSSAIAGMAAERQAARAAVETIPVTRPWLFEFSSASSLPLTESYLGKVRDCDIFVLLLKDAPTEPVKAEVETAQAAGKPLLVFLAESAPPDTAAYARSLGVKYAGFRDAEHLAHQVAEAVGDELIAGYRRHALPRADLGRLGDFLDELAQGLRRFEARGDQVVMVSGTQNVVNTGSVGRDLKVIYGNVYQGPETSDPTEALRIYREVLVYSTRSLPLRGVDVGVADPAGGQRPLDLANVYIHLDTKTSVPVETENAKGKRRKAAGFSRSVEATRPLPALEAAAKNRRLVLLGDPGSGKSTFANHLALCLAAAALQPEGEWQARLKDWPEADLIPVVVVLRDFARWLAANGRTGGEAGPKHLWDFLCGRLDAQNLAFAAAALHDALERGTVLVLYDGLDEIAGRAPAAFVRDAVAAFAGRYSRGRHLVTCRTLSYQHPDWQLAEFPVFELAPFDEGKIDGFVGAWYAELATQGSVPGGEVEGLSGALRSALRRPDLWRLAPNPLLLTVMALVHTHKGRLPDARALLYEETVDILLWRWEQIKATGSGEDVPQLRRLLLEAGRGDVDLKRALWRLAYEAHSQGGAGDDEVVADIGELRLLRELSNMCCGDLGWAQRVIETMKLRAGLLVERQPEVFSFPHRTFQEYLAGAHLAAQSDFARQASRLAAEGARWREVITLAAGKLVYLSGDLDKPLALAAELCPARAVDDESAWQRAWLAGDVLLEAGPGRVQDLALGRELLERVRYRLADLVSLGRLDPVERARAGDTLGRLGDPRPGVGLTADGLPDIAWCDVPAGPFLMGNTKETDEMAFPDEMPQHEAMIQEPYRIGKYPVTNAQFDAFVQDGGYQERRFWRQAASVGRWLGGRIKVRTWTIGAEQDFGETWADGPARYAGAYGVPNHPVVGVSWYEALAFCAWLSEKLGHKVSLPTEVQWERAARGTDGRRYPWGGDLTPDHANYDETKIGSPSAAGIFPRGESPYGALDMNGNVWEWCLTKWRENYEEPAGDDPEGETRRVLRGGAFLNVTRVVRCACRFRIDPDYRRSYFGFRVVASP